MLESDVAPMSRVRQWWNARDRRWLHLICAFVVGALVAIIGFGPAYVSGTSPFWKYPPIDFSSHIVGFNLYLHDDWHFPICDIHDSHHKRLSLLYTDSLPLLAIFAKATFRWVP